MRFVLIDRFLEIVPGVSAVASKTFAPDDEIFGDHFPGFSLVPGVLLAEAMGQTGGWLVAHSRGFREWPLLEMIEHLKLRRFVRPREEIRLEARIEAAHDHDVRIRAEAPVGGHRAAEGRFAFRLFPPGTIGSGADAELFEAWTRSVSAKLFAGIEAGGR